MYPRKKTVLFVMVLFGSILFSQTNSLNWEFAFLSESKGLYIPVDSERIIELSENSNFKLFLSTQSNCYCYVIYEDINGTETVLFSGSLIAASDLYLPSKNISSAYNITPPSGTEKIYIIVSALPQKDLEKILNKSVLDSKKILDEVLKIKKNLSSFTSEPVKPATTGGTTRSFSSDTEQERPYTLFSGTDVYVKTIRIKH